MPYFPASLNVSTLNGSNGFSISGAAGGDNSGVAVAASGDFNKDGYQDILIGSVLASGGGVLASGVANVVFGKASGFSSNIDLGALEPSEGFSILGANARDGVGYALDFAGDVNNDGRQDLLIGSFDQTGGKSYVLYGVEGSTESGFDLAIIDGVNGFQIEGKLGSDLAGSAVAAAGDINGDGISDFIVGAQLADPNSRNAAGESYVVFGSAAGFDASFDLTTLDGANGFTIKGATAKDATGGSVDSGDFNGDGVDDLIIGASGHASKRGLAHVVFGKTTDFAAVLDLDAPAEGVNLYINGIAVGDEAGISVASAGDVNGDGCDDMLIGASGVDGATQSSSGAAYVVFGRSSGLGTSIDLDSLDGTNGFVLSLDEDVASVGRSVAGAGDFNGDGYDDIVLGAPGRSDGANAAAGFGKG
jgi:hypothetical protein